MAVGLRLEHDTGRELDAGPAILSHHFSLAGDYARAHRYAMSAAERATEQFSHADAARLYRRAIDAGRADGGAGDPRSLAGAWEELGEALRNVGEPAPAAKALTEARKLLRDDPIAQARLCYRHAQVANRNAALNAAVRWLSGASVARRRRWHRCCGLARPHAVVPRWNPKRSGPLGAGCRDVPRSDCGSRVGRRAERARARLLRAR